MTKIFLWFFILLLLIILIFFYFKNGSDRNHEKISSQKILNLLIQAENQNLPIKIRAEAACDLRKYRDPIIVSRLIKLLPGNGDLLTAEIINSLGAIGDPIALPMLKEMYQDERGAFNFHGKIRVLLAYAIQDIEANIGDVSSQGLFPETPTGAEKGTP